MHFLFNRIPPTFAILSFMFVDVRLLASGMLISLLRTKLEESTPNTYSAHIYTRISLLSSVFGVDPDNFVSLVLC